MVERGGADGDETEQDDDADQRRPDRTRGAAGAAPQNEDCEQAERDERADEQRLVGPPLIIPMLGMGEVAADRGQQRLKVELLVDAERDQQQGDGRPEAAFGPRPARRQPGEQRRDAIGDNGGPAERCRVADAGRPAVGEAGQGGGQPSFSMISSLTS